MPQYRVTAPGFYDGKLYDPNGKRRVLTVAKAFTKKDLPSWLVLMKKGETVETKVDSKDSADEGMTQEEQQAEIDAVTFTEPPKSTQVETL